MKWLNSFNHYIFEIRFPTKPNNCVRPEINLCVSSSETGALSRLCPRSENPLKMLCSNCIALHIWIHEGAQRLKNCVNAVGGMLLSADLGVTLGDYNV